MIDRGDFFLVYRRQRRLTAEFGAESEILFSGRAEFHPMSPETAPTDAKLRRKGL
jgi:hypothetical protein